MAERTESIILDFEVDIEDSIESIDSLTKANKALRKERNALNIQSDTGKKRASEINALLDQNTNKIKSNTSAIERQRANIGNYKSALDGVHPSLGKVGEGLEAGASGFKAMARSALAFIATPIGAILTALVTVFTLLKTALSQNNELMDKFENITNAVGTVVQVIIGRIGKLGEALIALASGNFSEAIDLTSQAFSGLAAEISNAVTQSQLYLDLSRELEDAQRALRIEEARSTNQIKLLEQAAKNRNLTFDEQENRLREALRLQEEIIRKREENAQKDLVITAKQIALERQLSQTTEETFDQFVNRLLENGRLNDEQIDGLIGKIEALEQARGGALAFQQKLENDLAVIQEKRAAALAKQNAELERQSELERQARISRLERDLAGEDENPFATEAKLSDNLTSTIQKDLADRQKFYDDYYKKKTDAAAKSAAMEEELERNKFAIISGLSGSLAGLMREDSEAQRAITSAQALVNTYAAAVAAFKSGSEINVFFGVAAAAAAVAAGLANVARINSIEFADGGWTGPGNKYDVAGVVHADEYVVPKRVNNNPIAQPHIRALENMRLRPYADGGLVVNSSTQPINQQMELMNVIKNLPPVVASWSEGRKVGRRLEFKERISKR